jgi:hypothetical protein
VHAPRGLDHEGVIFIAYITIARKLRELEERYRHKLMNEEERLKLRERILKLREKAAIEAGRASHQSGPPGPCRAFLEALTGPPVRGGVGPDPRL